MESNNHFDTQPQPVAGPSGVNRKRDRSSSSSSSATSVSSSSTSTPGSKQARSNHRRRRHKKRKRARRSSHMMDKLFKEMGELRKQINTTSNIDTACYDNASVCSGISGQLYEQISDEDCSNQEHQQNASLDFTFDIDTKLKEPLVPKTPDSFLKKLVDIQRFGSTSWSEVRYADTQKLYNHTPGFIDLETNEEVKAYDTLRHLAHADKSYAALTYCILKQRQSLQEGIRNLLSWAKNTECINFDNLNGKIDELFQKGEFHKISSDRL